MKELEDLQLFPSTLRNFQTEYIGYLAARFGIYDSLVPELEEDTSSQFIFDLCSGSGEPAKRIFSKVQNFSGLFLSDKYPNRNGKLGEGVEYIPEKTDALHLSYESGMFYTMFNAFHHFTDAEKKQILKRIIEAKTCAIIVEPLTPGFSSFTKVFLASTVGQYVLSPFVKPFSFTRLIFTWFFPVNLFTVLFDGTISVIKSRSAKNYKELFAEFGRHVRVSETRRSLLPLVIIRVNT